MLCYIVYNNNFDSVKFTIKFNHSYSSRSKSKLNSRSVLCNSTFILVNIIVQLPNIGIKLCKYFQLDLRKFSYFSLYDYSV